MKIYISAGHYPKKPGAVNEKYGINEHWIASKVVVYLKDMLEDDGHNVVVGSGKLRDKTQQVNSGYGGKKFDFATDIHFNADDDHLDPHDLDDTRGTGVMVMHYPGNEKRKEQADDFAEIIATTLKQPNRGGREGYYWGGDHPGTIGDYFLRKTNCPALITEAGYIDNNLFAEMFLLDDEGIESIARAHFNAIIGVFGG